MNIEALLADFLEDLAKATPEMLMADAERAREDSQDSDLLD